MRLTGLLLCLVLALAACGSRSSGTGSLPGGTTGEGVLSDRHLLDQQGRVRVGTPAQSAAVQTAVCDYVFGTPEQVVRAADVQGKASLRPSSGLTTVRGRGTGIQCGFDVSGKAVLDLVVWSAALDLRAGEDRHLVTRRLHDGLVGYSAYGASYPGRTMSDATARRWLDAAGRRVQG